MLLRLNNSRKANLKELLSIKIHIFLSGNYLIATGGLLHVHAQIHWQQFAINIGTAMSVGWEDAKTAIISRGLSTTAEHVLL